MPPDSEDFEIVTVQAGARSIRSRQFGETFHPVIGPMAEARALHVEGARLRERLAAMNEAFVVWDVGLGAAANALAVIEEAGGKLVELHSFDRTTAPLAFALKHADELVYLAPHRRAVEALLATGHATAGTVEWSFHPGDFAETLNSADAPAPHAILYDPYSPATNPDMWTLEHFTNLHARLDPARSCLLTNYTRSTAVRVTLLLAGFFVGYGPATGEKIETTIAANASALLAQPLDHEWLDRVARSTRGAPLRRDRTARVVGADDLARLRVHPQFAGYFTN
jgi:tRNA U34 5-methylaminomethyl-2-thiouridine-forming methyltransferase MnmC